MPTADVTAMAARLGLGDLGPAQQVAAGYGGNELWRLPSDGGDWLLRVFPPSSTARSAEREAAAHALAADHGVPTPRVAGCALLDDRPVLAMQWLAGVSLSRSLLSGRDPDALGRRCGQLLARLHRISTVPAVIADRDWVDWAGVRAGALRGLMPSTTEPCLLHLDFHPENLIIDDQDTIWVLDWANVRLGPPVAELARTLSILELVEQAAPQITDAARTLLGAFWSGLLEGYAGCGGDVGIPPAVMAWAYAVQLEDLAGSWVPDWYLDRLAQRYHELLP